MLVGLEELLLWGVVLLLRLVEVVAVLARARGVVPEEMGWRLAAVVVAAIAL